MIKFVLTAHNSADADAAANTLNRYMASATFRADLVAQGGQLTRVTSTSVAITPTTAITAGIDSPTAKDDDDDDTAGKDALIAVLSITSALALCGVVLAGMYILKNRSEGGLSAQDANAMVYGNTVEDAYGVGDNDPDQGSYPIPVAEVVGVSSPSWESVRVEDDNQHMDIAMQEMPAMRAAPPSYEGEDDDEKETSKFV